MASGNGVGHLEKSEAVDFKLDAVVFVGNHASSGIGSGGDWGEVAEDTKLESSGSTSGEACEGHFCLVKNSVVVAVVLAVVVEINNIGPHSSLVGQFDSGCGVIVVGDAVKCLDDVLLLALGRNGEEGFLAELRGKFVRESGREVAGSAHLVDVTSEDVA